MIKDRKSVNGLEWVFMRGAWHSFILGYLISVYRQDGLWWWTIDVDGIEYFSKVGHNTLDKAMKDAATAWRFTVDDTLPI